jgi:hypothetical protein
MSISNTFHHALNKNKYPSEYYDFSENGQPVLKQGYATSGDIGGSKKVHTIKGKANQYKRWGGGKDSYKWTGGTPAINIYKLPGQQAAAPAPAPAAPPPSQPSAPGFDDRLSGIQDQYNQQNDRLMQQLAADRANYEAMMQRMEQQISNYQNSYNQPSNVGGQETALMINPAQSGADKSRSTSKGTQQFNRRNRNMNLKISNVSI